jgi:hypothetical protein
MKTKELGVGVLGQPHTSLFYNIHWVIRLLGSWMIELLNH